MRTLVQVTECVTGPNPELLKNWAVAPVSAVSQELCNLSYY